VFVIGPAGRYLVKYYIWSIALYDAEIWTLRQEDMKYLKSFEMLSWRRVEICWTDNVSNEVLHTVKEKRYILPTYNKKEEG
jgi:hypothetical protein